MGQQFLFVGQAAEVKADHLVGPQRRLATGPQADQQAGDDRAVRLNLDAVLVVAQQVPAAQQVLEESEKDFNRPPLGIYQSDDLGGTSNRFVAIRSMPSLSAPVELPLYLPRLVWGEHFTHTSRIG